ncbi:hypothetical protein C9J98_03870 [Stenotrophomonas panacihumi]|nr:hypothetical protein [Stenotrophomonas panacihumi]PTN55725.1 hypothetical protein C9J98_03870 [Stenotrophomonas panacihumi]
MSRRKHPHPDIEDALRHAEAQGWRIKVGGGHAWGRMYCPYNNVLCRCGEFCLVSIWSTPRVPEHHARQLRRVVDSCLLERAKHHNA